MPARIALSSVAASGLLLVVLGFAYLESRSLLALSQAADSLSDVFTAAALWYSMRVGAEPADAEHPRGHHRAEPIAALIAAVLAGVLGVEVVRAAIAALTADATPAMSWSLAGAFGLKVVTKLAVVVWASASMRTTRSPALNALRVDARNDVLVGVLALAGFFAARYGSVGWDAWLAMPVGVWIAYSGFDLARDSIGFLMGAAPDDDRQAALRAAIDGVVGVTSSHDLNARYEGAGLDVTTHIVVDETLTLRQAHDIANAVEERLVREDDVVHAMVHVDVD